MPWGQNQYGCRVCETEYALEEILHNYAIIFKNEGTTFKKWQTRLIGVV